MLCRRFRPFSVGKVDLLKSKLYVLVYSIQFLHRFQSLSLSLSLSLFTLPLANTHRLLEIQKKSLRLTQFLSSNMDQMGPLCAPADSRPQRAVALLYMPTSHLNSQLPVSAPPHNIYIYILCVCVCVCVCVWHV
jgi:hypothetical protein